MAPEGGPDLESAPDPDRDGAPLAEPGQRLVARIIDLLVVGLPVVMVTQAVFPRRIVESVAAVALGAVLMVYETVQLALWGRTFGKRVVGISVIPAAGPWPSPGGAGEGGYADHDPAGAPSSRPDRQMRPVRLGVVQAWVRAVTYALPIAVRPVPILGVMAGFFWIANAGLIFEGADRLALHDRLARTKVIMVR